MEATPTTCESEARSLEGAQTSATATCAVYEAWKKRVAAKKSAILAARASEGFTSHPTRTAFTLLFLSLFASGMPVLGWLCCRTCRPGRYSHGQLSHPLFPQPSLISPTTRILPFSHTPQTLEMEKSNKFGRKMLNNQFSTSKS